MKKGPPRLSPSASLRYRGVKQKQLAAILFWSTQKVAMAAVQKKKEGPASRSATQKDIEKWLQTSCRPEDSSHIQWLSEALQAE
jgi:hypothetical protein